MKLIYVCLCHPFAHSIPNELILLTTDYMLTVLTVVFVRLSFLTAVKIRLFFCKHLCVILHTRLFATSIIMYQISNLEDPVHCECLDVTVCSGLVTVRAWLLVNFVEEYWGWALIIRRLVECCKASV